MSAGRARFVMWYMIALSVIGAAWVGVTFGAVALLWVFGWGFGVNVGAYAAGLRARQIGPLVKP